MHQSAIIRTAAALIAAVAMGIFGGQIACAQQQQPIKRTDLLKTHLERRRRQGDASLGGGHSARRGDRAALSSDSKVRLRPRGRCCFGTRWEAAADVYGRPGVCGDAWRASQLQEREHHRTG